MEAVEQHEVEILAYHADIRTTSHDMLLLYSGSSDIEVGTLLQKLQLIFSVLHPLEQRTLEDLQIGCIWHA